MEKTGTVLFTVPCRLIYLSVFLGSHKRADGSLEASHFQNGLNLHHLFHDSIHPLLQDGLYVVLTKKLPYHGLMK